MQNMASALSHGSAVPGPVPGELIVPTSRPIGYQLLQKMGWKEGQGIGNRKRRAVLGSTKHIQGKTGQLSFAAGVGMIEGLDLSSLPEGAVVDGELLFAAKDDIAEQMSRMPTPKADMYGLGFHAALHGPGEMSLTIGSRFSSADSFSGGVYSVSDLLLVDGGGAAGGGRSFGHRVKGMRDQGGFAIDDGEDDVYDYDPAPSATTTETTYHTSNKSATGAAGSGKGGGSGGGRQLIKDVTAVPVRRCRTDDRLPLEGFVLMTIADDTDANKPSGSRGNGIVEDNVAGGGFIKIFYPPPVVPKEFKEWHTFEEDISPSLFSSLSSASALRAQVPPRHKDASNTTVDTGGGANSSGGGGRGVVYGMLDAKGREQLDRALGKVKAEPHNSAVPMPSVAAAYGSSSNTSDSGGISDSRVAMRSLDRGRMAVPGAMSQGLAVALQSRFTSSSQTSTSNPGGGGGNGSGGDIATATAEGLVLKPGMVTAAELRARREALELAAAASSSAGTTTASTTSSTGSSRSGKKVIARVSSIWIPNRLLCKRMNVPMPDVSLQSATNSADGASRSGSGAGFNGGSGSGSGEVGSSREEQVFQKHIGAYASLGVLGSIAGTATATAATAAAAAGGGGVNAAGGFSASGGTKMGGGGSGVDRPESPPPPPRPPMSLFKSIFEDSDSDDSDSDSDDDDRSDDDRSDDDDDDDKKKRETATATSVGVGSTGSGDVAAEHKDDTHSHIDTHITASKSAPKKLYTVTASAEYDSSQAETASGHTTVGYHASGRDFMDGSSGGSGVGVRTASPANEEQESRSLAVAKVLYRKPTAVSQSTAAGSGVGEVSIGTKQLVRGRRGMRERGVGASTGGGSGSGVRRIRVACSFEDDERESENEAADAQPEHQTAATATATASTIDCVAATSGVVKRILSADEPGNAATGAATDDGGVSGPAHKRSRPSQDQQSLHHQHDDSSGCGPSSSRGNSSRREDSHTHSDHSSCSVGVGDGGNSHMQKRNDITEQGSSRGVSHVHRAPTGQIQHTSSGTAGKSSLDKLKRIMSSTSACAVGDSEGSNDRDSESDSSDDDDRSSSHKKSKNHAHSKHSKHHHRKDSSSRKESSKKSSGRKHHKHSSSSSDHKKKKHKRSSS
jgi:hypothetical protein